MTIDGAPRSPALTLLAINLTRRCNLACAHCYLDAGTLARGDDDELSTAEVRALLDDVAAMGHDTMVVLTGGEPLLRSDLERLIAHGAGLGLPMVVGTNASLLGEERLRSLRDAGLLGLGISLDSLDPESHDAFRGRPGSWDKTMAGIERCRQFGVAFQLHLSLTERNAHELSAMVDFAHAAGARALNVFFLVCVGRGRSFVDLTPQRYEELLREVIDAQARHAGLIVRARCAPHAKRVAVERHPLPAAQGAHLSGRDGDGCIAGVHYARVNYRGGVTACPYIEHEVGNVREHRLSRLWREAQAFARLRSPQLAGKCGACEYRALCGGCRARPLARGGDLMDADDLCLHQPQQAAALLQPLGVPNGGSAMRWTAGAQGRLARIPAVLREMVKKRAEAHVAALGGDVITAQHLADMATARFGASGPPKWPAWVQRPPSPTPALRADPAPPAPLASRSS